MSEDRLRDPDRFAGRLAGIVYDVCRAVRRQADNPQAIRSANATANSDNAMVNADVSRA